MKEAIKELTGWRLCKHSSCKFAHIQSDNINDIFIDDYNYYTATPGALLKFQKTQSLSGTPSMIIYGEFRTSPKAFLEIDQGFSVLPPRLFHFEESDNKCGNIWSFEVSNILSTMANLRAKVYNYGEVNNIIT